MTTVNVFGPQGENAVTVQPSTYAIQRYIGETFAQDCIIDSAGNSTNGTIIDAAWYNRVSVNLNAVVTEANNNGAALDPTPSNQTALVDAIKYLSGNTITASAPITRVGDVIKLDPTSAPSMAVADIAATNDTLMVYDASAALVKTIPIGKAINAALQAGSGGVQLAVNNVTGKTTISMDTSFFVGAITSLPVADGVDPANDRLAIWDASQTKHAYIPIDNLPRGAGFQGSYTTAQLGTLTAAQNGDTAQVTDSAVGASASALVWYDGTNWRLAADNQIVI